MFQTQSPPWPWAGYHIRRLTKKVEEEEEVVRRATCYEMSSNNCLCLLRRLGSLAQGGCQCQTRGAMAGPTTPAAPCPASHNTGVQQVSLHSHWAGHRPWTPHTVKLYITWSFREALAMILLILHNQKDLKHSQTFKPFLGNRKSFIWFDFIFFTLSFETNAVILLFTGSTFLLRFIGNAALTPPHLETTAGFTVHKLLGVSPDIWTLQAHFVTHNTDIFQIE